ncbi:MAG: hypothetical protein ACK5F7_05090 [Planctomycetaceae bacterium]
MAIGNDRTENPQKRPPLGLPIGSVRALLTLQILAVFVVETLRGHQLPGLWSVTVLLAIAHYFSSRSTLAISAAQVAQLESNPAVPLERRPLFLHPHLLRGVVLLSLVGVLAALYSVQGVRQVNEVPPQLLGAVAYVAGAVCRLLFSQQRHPTSRGGLRLWDDLNALAVLLPVTGVCVMYYLDQGAQLPDLVRNYVLALVLFYFGSR